MNAKEFFYENGYFLFKSVLAENQIKGALCDIRQVFESANYQGDDRSIMDLFARDFESFLGCAKACQNLVSISALACSDDLIECLGQLGIRLPSFNTRPLLSFSHKATAKKEQNWKLGSHQDWPSVQGSLNGVTCWVPLVPVGATLGPLEILPGSNRLGYLEHDLTDVPILGQSPAGEFVPIPMDVGDVLVFNSFTVHRSGNNESESIRISAHFRYNDVLEPTFVQRKMPVFRTDLISKEIGRPGWPNKEQMEEFILSEFNRSLQAD